MGLFLIWASINENQNEALVMSFVQKQSFR